MTSEKFLLCRPRGGLNDALVQLEACRAYAAKHRRRLVVDMSRGGLKDDFHRYFKPLPHFGPELLPWSKDVAAALDRLQYVVPPEVAGRLASYRTSFVDNRFRLDGGDLPVLFDFSRDHREDLLVYEQGGGGVAALNLLRHLAFSEEVASEILRRLERLGADYDAVHVRHSDYQTDYRRFLRRIAPALRGRRVLLCTDSRAVQAEAPELLRGCARIMTLFDVPETGGQSLHSLARDNAFDANLDTLTDLLALASARRLYFTTVTKGVLSGFSILAEGLRQQPQLVRGLLRDGRAELLADYEARHRQDRRAQLSFEARLGRLAVSLGQLAWNSKAKRQSRRLRRDFMNFEAADPIPALGSGA
ncbi:hypothetical protein [Acidimangrovimonas pyrenivorans]|uniref:Uncharacterized protein n=1 Tax=Acidimangrovimonas pyrenivorans TaxID=2030798 RepID=A0ABV7AN57_9RHOB